MLLIFKAMEEANAMLGLLTADDISKMCKTFRTRAVNPINVTIIQEQLLLAVRFWVTNRQ